MANLFGGQAVVLIKSENLIRDGSGLDEHDDQLRMKSREFGSEISSGVSEIDNETKPMSLIDVKMEDQACYSQLLQDILSLPSGCFLEEEEIETIGQKKIHTVTTEASAKTVALDLSSPDNAYRRRDFQPGGFDCQGIILNGCDCSFQILSPEINSDSFGVEKLNGNVCCLTQIPTVSTVLEKVNSEFVNHNQESNFGETICGFAGSDMQVVEIKTKVPYELMDELEHIFLKDRQRILLSRTLLRNTESVLEGVSQNSCGSGKVDIISDGRELCVVESSYGSPRSGMNISDSHMGIKESSSEINASYTDSCGEQIDEDTIPDNLLALSTFVKVETSDNNNLEIIDKSVKEFSFNNLPTVKSGTDRFSRDELDHMPLRDRIKLLATGEVSTSHISANSKKFKKILPISDLSDYEIAGLSYGSPKSGINISDSHMGVKEGPSEINASDPKSCGGQIDGNTIPDNMLPLLRFVKVEASDNNTLEIIDKSSVKEFSFNNLPTMKSETDRFSRDELDHMPLRDRIKLLATGEVSPSHIFSSTQNFKKILPIPLEANPVILDYIKPVTIKRLRKRKKTATDSIETALEEDAPGLLQVLIDKGISVDEIRLYGEPESDDVIDDSSIVDSFSELEDIISKLFSHRQSLMKFAPVRCSKTSQISYCLACLISLVEQTRFLRMRKWPVEWGWCRDLQSFIFVFERHHRIVMERPEYGYATYFFELIDSLPIDWQIKRLVTAMKLTSCSRINLLENKALMVGEDLSEGEANVLKQYGWIQNTGLGTMLNYRDRVFHDRNNVKDSSDWRSKIGKLLMDGYNGGTIVLRHIPEKVMEYTGALTVTPHIKLEL